MKREIKNIDNRDYCLRQLENINNVFDKTILTFALHYINKNTGIGSELANIKIGNINPEEDNYFNGRDLIFPKKKVIIPLQQQQHRELFRNCMLKSLDDYLIQINSRNQNKSRAKTFGIKLSRLSKKYFKNKYTVSDYRNSN